MKTTLNGCGAGCETDINTCANKCSLSELGRTSQMRAVMSAFGCKADTTVWGNPLSRRLCTAYSSRTFPSSVKTRDQNERAAECAACGSPTLMHTFLGVSDEPQRAKACPTPRSRSYTGPVPSKIKVRQCSLLLSQSSGNRNNNPFLLRCVSPLLAQSAHLEAEPAACPQRLIKDQLIPAFHYGF